MSPPKKKTMTILNNVKDNMVNNKELKTTEELSKENEIMGKILIEMILHNDGISDERITRLFNQEDWKERVEFKVYDDGDIGWKGQFSWLSKPAKTFRRFKREKEEAIVKNKELEETISNCWNLIDEQKKEIDKLRHHKKIVSEALVDYHLLGNEGNSNWHGELVQEIEKGEKSDAIINIIRHWKSEAEKWEEEAMIHLDAIGVSEIWNKRIASELREEIGNGLELIEESDEVIKSQQEQITKLNEFYLANKSLPKTPSKFKIFKEKTKVKFQQFKQLVTKKKTQKPELIAQIEVRTN